MLVELLDAVPGLRRSDLACYEAGEGVDRLDLSLIACDEAGSYAVHKDKVPERINMVELICSSGSPQAYESALALAVRIAETLGWEVADSDTGEVLHARLTG